MKVTRIITLFLSLFLIGLALWTNRFFGRVTVDQTLSTIAFTADGVLSGDSIYIKRFIEWCLYWPSIILVILQGLMLFCIKMKWGKNLAAGLPVFLLLLGISMVAYQYQLVEFFGNFYHDQTDLFQSAYVDPNKIVIKKAKHPKSLVLIYIESLENTYSKKELFGHDLLASLKTVTASDLHFGNYQQMPGASWTMAGIVATQCGIPLRMVTIFNGNRVGENISRYLPGAKCLSDILAEHGYKNIYMNGSALVFSGKNVFLRDHHYSESYGREEWLKQGAKPSDMTGWGLGDDQLFEKAKIKLAELIKGKQPFNLMILTVDTHGFDGKLNARCYAKGYRQFPGIVECTANEVADFVTFIKKNGWLDRVNVVIQGDHLAMRNNVSHILTKEPHRTLYNALISKRKLEKNTDQIVHADMLPTILDLLGFSYPGGKLGLGYSALRHPKISAPEDRMPMLAAIDTQYSASYNQLWSTPHNTTQ